MFFPILSLLIIALTTSTTLAASLPFSTSIFTWPLTADKPTLLAEISYDPTTLTTSLNSYHAPNPSSSSTDDNLTRLGLYNKDTKEWTGTLTSASSLSPPASDNSTLTLHLNPSKPEEIYHVSLSPSSTSATTESKLNDALQVALLRASAGATPQLSKPVAPKQGGDDEQGEEEEKTLFQR
ncbi:hypothetical protein FQN54_002422 [Arachnomyces sp. PD_36]|nr:hypothetical protein FQN54_002422 [Arachnomyces sp. PD_36]